MKLATAKVRNQTPSMTPLKLFGETLVTIESPVGDKDSSPIVWRKYTKKIHKKWIWSRPESKTNGK